MFPPTVSFTSSDPGPLLLAVAEEGPGASLAGKLSHTLFSLICDSHSPLFFFRFSFRGSRRGEGWALFLHAVPLRSRALFTFPSFFPPLSSSSFSKFPQAPLKREIAYAAASLRASLLAWQHEAERQRLAAGGAPLGGEGGVNKKDRCRIYLCAAGSCATAALL